MRRRFELYRFRYFDTLRQRWLQARYVLEAPAILHHRPQGTALICSTHWGLRQKGSPRLTIRACTHSHVDSLSYLLATMGEKLPDVERVQ